jgi:hypothetical protein
MLSEAFLSDEFSNERKWGFQIESSSKRLIQGRFIERNEFVEKVIDPFGEIFEFARVEYTSLSFRFGTEIANLELYDPPVSLIPTFLNQLGTYLSFKVSISPVQIDVLKWLNLFEPHVEALVVKVLMVTDISLSNTVQAQVVLTGTQDVRAFVAKIAGGRNHRILKATFEAKSLEREVKCEIGSEGRVNLIRGGDDSILSLLRLSISNAIAPQ